MKDLDEQIKPNLPFLRKWVNLYKEEWGVENEVSKELQQCLLYVSFLQDRVKQLELYNECFQKIIEQDKDQKCQTKKN